MIRSIFIILRLKGYYLVDFTPVSYTHLTYAAIQGKKECKLYVYEAIREDAYVLYGFADKQERDVYKRQER